MGNMLIKRDDVPSDIGPFIEEPRPSQRTCYGQHVLPLLHGPANKKYLLWASLRLLSGLHLQITLSTGYHLPGRV